MFGDICAYSLLLITSVWLILMIAAGAIEFPLLSDRNTGMNRLHARSPKHRIPWMMQSQNVCHPTVELVLWGPGPPSSPLVDVISAVSSPVGASESK